MISFLDVMDWWPSDVELACDLGVKLSRVQKWRTRRAIPVQAWPMIITAARSRGFQITAEDLLRANHGTHPLRHETRATA